jgi:trimethylamine monooxygenase
VALESCPNMMYIGMQDQFFTFNMFDAQAWWARDVVLGRVTVPASLQERVKDSVPWVQREGELGEAAACVVYLLR